MGFPSQSTARQGWYQAVQTAAFNTSGGLKAGPANKSFFYTALLHRQRSAFGPFGFHDVDWSKFDVASFPWALPDQIFEKLYPDVMADRGPTYERPATWDDVVKIGEGLGLITPAGSLGKKLLKTFLTRSIPALTEGALAEWAMPVASGVAFTAVVVEAWAARTHNAQTKQAFRIDKQRRDYDRTVANAVATR